MRLTLSKKLIGSFMIVALLGAVSGIVGIVMSGSIAKSGQVVSEEKAPQQYSAISANLALAQVGTIAEKYKTQLTGLNELESGYAVIFT